MKQKPDFHQMPRKELRQYVLSHREDEDALQIYMQRLRAESGVIRHQGGLQQNDIAELEHFIQQRGNTLS